MQGNNSTALHVSVLYSADKNNNADQHWAPESPVLEQWVIAALSYFPAIAQQLMETGSQPTDLEAPAVAVQPTDALTETVQTESPSNVNVEVSVSAVSSEHMRALNQQYRNKDGDTNVLSFPSDMPALFSEHGGDSATVVLGDIVLCPEVLEKEASAQGKSLHDHWAHMVIHSLLHLNGMDHNSELSADTMESHEIQILSNLGISNPYLVASANQS